MHDVKVSLCILEAFPYNNTIRYDTMRYDALRCDTIRYEMIRYDTIRYNTIQYNTPKYYYIVLYCIVVACVTIRTCHYDTITPLYIHYFGKRVSPPSRFAILANASLSWHFLKGYSPKTVIFVFTIDRNPP